MTDDQIERLVRRGYLLLPDGRAWKVPEDVADIYQESFPKLGVLCDWGKGND